MPELATTLHTRLAALHEQLEREYGWARLEPTIEVRGPLVRVSARVAAPSVARRIQAALVEALPLGSTLQLDLRPLPILAWYALVEPRTRLWRHHPDHVGARELATELAPGCGPLGLLARAGEAQLVRARDGTLGWTLDRLGEPTSPRPLTAPHEHADAAARLLAAARSWLGTPYLLGGASRDHIDCSALVQRAFVDALGLVLPKNSNDQLACAGGGRRDQGVPEFGELLFIHSRRERRTHVGLTSERGTIVQASRTRSAVVEVALADYLADAGWQARVAPADLLTWSRTQVGRDAIELPNR